LDTDSDFASNSSTPRERKKKLFFSLTKQKKKTFSQKPNPKKHHIFSAIKPNKEK